jgi:hypothetical protein
LMCSSSSFFRDRLLFCDFRGCLFRKFSTLLHRRIIFWLFYKSCFPISSHGSCFTNFL